MVALIGFALRSSTDDRSLGLLAVAGVIGLVACIADVRRPGVRSPPAGAYERPLDALAGIVASAAFIVVGILFAAGILHWG